MTGIGLSYRDMRRGRSRNRYSVGAAALVAIALAAPATEAAELKLPAAGLTVSLPGEWSVRQASGDRPLDELVRSYPTLPALTVRVERVASSEGCKAIIERSAGSLQGARRVEAPQYVPTGFEPTTVELSSEDETAVFACGPIGGGHLSVVFGYRGPAFHADAPFIVRPTLAAIWRAGGGQAAETKLPGTLVVPGPGPNPEDPDEPDEPDEPEWDDGDRRWIPSFEVDIGVAYLSADTAEEVIGGSLGLDLSLVLTRFDWLAIQAEAGGLAGYDGLERWTGDARGQLALSIAPVSFFSLAGFGGGGWDVIDGSDDPAAFMLPSAGYGHYGGRLGIYPGGGLSLLGSFARVHRGDDPGTIEHRVRAGIGYGFEPFGIRALFTFGDYETAEAFGGALGFTF